MLPLTGDSSMLQQTVDRIRDLIPPDRIWIMTNQEYVALAQDQLPEVPADQIVGEPEPRGTAPAIGLGAQHVAARDPQGVMFALHADHYIEDESGFREAMLTAAAVAQEGWLVNLGVRPTRPETGYGYVELGDGLGGPFGEAAFHVLRFREKPDAETAQQFVDSGRFLWNSGIFCWRADVIRQEFLRYLPDIQRTLDEIGRHIGHADASDQLQRLWQALPHDTTIDRGIMEKATRVATVPINVGWNDVGAWDALAALLPSDEAGNSAHGPGDALLLNAKNVFVHSDDKLIAIVGVEDLVIVDTKDALLVIARDQAQQVKELVSQLKQSGRESLL